MSNSAPPPTTGIVVAAGRLDGQLDLARLFGRDAGTVADVPPGTSAHQSAGGPAPLELEIGCGKGRFLLAAAARWPDRDFLAVEHSRRLVRKVRDRILREGRPNVRLYHGNARDLVTRLLPSSCLARVHVYFPDPWPKRRHAKHRLFADPFPDHLARVLEPGGQLLLATDHDPYFRGVVARLAAHREFVRTTVEEAFADIPSGGFDAIFAARGIPVQRACWQKVQPMPGLGGT